MASLENRARPEPVIDPEVVLAAMMASRKPEADAVSADMPLLLGTTPLHRQRHKSGPQLTIRSWAIENRARPKSL